MRYSSKRLVKTTMREISLKGTGAVYSFTLSQLLKSKGSITTIVMILLMSFVVMPIASLAMGSERESEATEIAYENVACIYIQNESDLPFYCENAELKKLFPNAAIASVANADELSKHDIKAIIEMKNGIDISISASDDTLLTEAECSALADVLSQQLYNTFIGSAGISPDVFNEINSNFGLATDNAGSFYSWEMSETSFILQYVYSILLMMFSMMSVSYIVRTVVEEKSSKLVELLMVSVKPLALICGKILAIATYIFGIIALMVLSFGISSGFTESAMSFGPADLLAGVGITDLSFNMTSVVYLIVSFAVAYMTISLLAGIMGTACSSTEDMQSSTLSVTMVVMTGYMISCIASMFEGALAYATSLVPIVSAFCAPVNYLLGKIPLYVALISLTIQLLILILFSYLCAKVYRELIVYNGKRVKFLDILKMAREKGGCENV